MESHLGLELFHEEKRYKGYTWVGVSFGVFFLLAAVGYYLFHDFTERILFWLIDRHPAWEYLAILLFTSPLWAVLTFLTLLLSPDKDYDITVYEQGLFIKRGRFIDAFHFNQLKKIKIVFEEESYDASTDYAKDWVLGKVQTITNVLPENEGMPHPFADKVNEKIENTLDKAKDALNTDSFAIAVYFPKKKVRMRGMGAMVLEKKYNEWKRRQDRIRKNNARQGK